MSESSSLNTGFSLNSKNVLFCGVYILDCAFTSISGGGSRPIAILSSMSDLGKIGKNNAANGYILYPGFKIDLYNSTLYAGYSKSYDNTNSTEIIVRQVPSADQVGSIKVYYNGTEIILNNLSNNTEATLGSAT